MRGKPIIYERLDTGCIVPTSHKLNKDGYFRCRDEKFMVSFSTACGWIREWKA